MKGGGEVPISGEGLAYSMTAGGQRCAWIAGPGLAVRILGDVTEGDKLEVLRQVDEIFVNTIHDFGIYDDIWQAFAVFLPVKYSPLHHQNLVLSFMHNMPFEKVRQVSAHI